MSAASIDETIELERKPNLVRDVCALVLIAFTLILTVSLVTHNAADPLDTPIWPISEFYTPDATIFPPNATITNACGYWSFGLNTGPPGFPSGLVVHAQAVVFDGAAPNGFFWISNAVTLSVP